jgi:hypothetical protein
MLQRWEIVYKSTQKPQRMKTPNLASVNNCGVGRASINSQFGSYRCFSVAKPVCSSRLNKHRTFGIRLIFILLTESPNLW